MADIESAPYVVVCADDEFRIVNESGRTIMSCGDQGSAEHYADLLISAYESGFRAGRRWQISD